MRTDSVNYSKEFLEKAKKYIKDKYSDEYVGKDIDLLSERKVEKKKKRKKKKKTLKKLMNLYVLQT